MMEEKVLHIDLDVATGTGLSCDGHRTLRLQDGAGGYAPEGECVSAVVDTALHEHVSLQWIEQWTAPQQWRKHPANPVYGPHRSGAWDTWTNGVSIVLCPDGKTYRMFYAGQDGEGIGFAEASVDDPIIWNEAAVSPVLRPRADNWEGNRINQPRVVVVSPDHWRMYYTGWGCPGGGSPWAMGVAESFDGGVTWERRGDDPILDRGDPGSPDGGGACVPMVLRVDGRWMMWYTAGVINPEGHTQIHLCLAVSEDGLCWRKHEGNPVLGDDFSDNPARSVTSRCYVRHDDGVFRMWYSYAKPKYEIRYAESLNGIDWTRSPIAPVLGPSSAPAWDDDIVEYPEVQIVDGVFRLWFCGNGYGSVGYAEGVPETGVDIAHRWGATHTPDETWTDWMAGDRSQMVVVSQFMQVRARLWSKNSLLSPALSDVRIHLET
jgi:predicted GH43/DUF377 family glycosyl hydrolase